MKRNFKLLIVLANLFIFLFNLSVYAKNVDLKKAIRQSKSWLETIDNSKYQESWNNSSPAFKKAVSEQKWMAGEERSHAEEFIQIKDNLDIHDDNHILDEMRDILLDDIIGKKSFSLQDTSFFQIKNREELIETFILFEEDTILFYEILLPLAEESDNISVIQGIIDDERTHIKHLRSLLPT